MIKIGANKNLRVKKRMCMHNKQSKSHLPKIAVRYSCAKSLSFVTTASKNLNKIIFTTKIWRAIEKCQQKDKTQCKSDAKNVTFFVSFIIWRWSKNAKTKKRQLLACCVVQNRANSHKIFAIVKINMI